MDTLYNLLILGLLQLIISINIKIKDLQFNC